MTPNEILPLLVPRIVKFIWGYQGKLVKLDRYVGSTNKVET